MDMSELERLEAQQRTMKLSAVIRKCGWTAVMDYDHCVLGKAYRAVTGRSLLDDGERYRGKHELPFTLFAAEALGVPLTVASGAELLCIGRKHSPSQIADWVEGQGY